MDEHYLTPLFAPQQVVVFAGRDGAERGSTPIGRTLSQAIRAQRYTGKLHFIDVDTTGRLGDLTQNRADLAVIALPAPEVPAALELAGRTGCRAALVLGNGGTPEQAAELQRIARREDIYLLGPNSLGFQTPRLGLNASAAGPLARAGSLGLICQSGALTASIIDWAGKSSVGFSHLVSLGPGTAIDTAEVLDFLANDWQTQSIVVYLEGISSGRRFMSALRMAAGAKPVVVLKAGRRAAGNEAAQTHSGSTVGSDEVFDAALRRAGAVRVRSFVELFSAAKCLASRFRPVGKRLAIVTNGGGPGVLAADWVNEIGLELGKLSPESAKALAEKLPPGASLTDLIDLSEDGGAEQVLAAVRSAGQDRGVDGVLVIHSPKPGLDSEAIARSLATLDPPLGKPLLGCWMGDASVGSARHVLNEASIPTFRTPEAAVGAFGNIARFHENQRLLQQTPPPLSALSPPDIAGAKLVIESALSERRKVLTEMESKTLLSAFHIPVTPTLLARSANEAMMIATQLGFPVALKIDSAEITHKSDVQGVVLDIQTGQQARDAYLDMVERVARLAPEARINGVTVQKMARARRGREVSIGVVTDDPFGPVIVFGAGGVMIELIGDRAMELPPLNQYLARRLIERSRVAETLGEWRGASAIDMAALEQMLLRVSDMVCALPQLREMDINPVIVDESGAVAVDARIVVDSLPHAAASGHYGQLAILPYPARYEETWPLPGGELCELRPILPQDAEMLQALVRQVSPESRFFRFASHMRELPPSMLARFTQIDYDRELALVAVLKSRTADTNGEMAETERIIGVSRYVMKPTQTSCEFSLLVDDGYRGKGLGSRLMEAIMRAARDKGLAEMDGLVLASNGAMLRLVRSLGFSVRRFDEDPDFRWVTRSL